jgi:FeS assembly protein IscX
MNDGDRSGRDHTGRDLDAQYSWEDSYGIALALIERHPNIPLEEISLGMIYRWTLELPEFVDDPELANDSILSAIYQEWFEEVNPL